MMKFLLQKINRIPPLTIFVMVCGLSFGTQLPWLGFYLDDWIILSAYNMGGPERVFEYAYLDNRPLIAWTWIIGLKLFGTKAIYWQIWTLFWRLATVTILWLGWKKIWPNASRQLTLAGLLFLIYPLFRQQPSALSYSFQWICFFLYGLSIYWMIQAVRQPERFTIYMIGSCLTGVIQLFSQEYYVGLELLRPMIIWLVLSHFVTDRKDLFRRIFLTWLPFLVILIANIIWRFVLMPSSGANQNTPTLMISLISSPITAIKTMLVMVLQDFIEANLGVWYATFQPGLIAVTNFAQATAWVIAGLVSGLVFVYFLWDFRKSPQSIPDNNEPWHKTAIPFGLFALFLGFVPGWSAGRHIYDLTGIYNDRFGLAAMFGAAIFLIAFLDLLLKKPFYLLVISSLLIGLGAGQHVRYLTNYRYSWEKQRQLFWQLAWRAPDIIPQTAVVGDGAIISYMGSWVTTSAILQMYEPTKNVNDVDYWYIDATKLNLSDRIDLTASFTDVRNFMRFSTPVQNSLVISFAPEDARCLWVLDKRDIKNRYLSDTLQRALLFSDPDRILTGTERRLREDIFGSEISRDWCFYYQKANLARQYEDWGSIVSLWAEAEQKDKHPRVGIEYAPFIEGFAHKQDWSTAIDLTDKAYFPKYEMRDYLCLTWQDIDRATADTPEKTEAIEVVIDRFECQDELGP